MVTRRGSFRLCLTPRQVLARSRPAVLVTLLDFSSESGRLRFPRVTTTPHGDEQNCQLSKTIPFRAAMPVVCQTCRPLLKELRLHTRRIYGTQERVMPFAGVSARLA